MTRAYTVSKDPKSGMWYAHAKGYPYIPVCGSISKAKSEALESFRICKDDELSS